MIVDERFSTYVASLEAPEEPLLERIEAEALAARVPIIRKETQSFLKTLLVPGDRDGGGVLCASDERLSAGGRAHHYH